MKNFFALALACLASPSLADGHIASAADIQAALIGNTVAGGMIDGSAYAEYYRADGVIKAAGYGGYWGLVGDKMCFDYGESVSCWNVQLDGGNVIWMNGATAEGRGSIASGNPNKF